MERKTEKFPLPWITCFIITIIFTISIGLFSQDFREKRKRIPHAGFSFFYDYLFFKIRSHIYPPGMIAIRIAPEHIVIPRQDRI